MSTVVVDFVGQKKSENSNFSPQIVVSSFGIPNVRR